MVAGSSTDGSASQELHPYAAKLPKPRAPADALEKVRLDQEHSFLQDVVSSLLKDRSLIGHMHATLCTLKGKRAASERPNDAPFPNSYNTFIRLPTYWMVGHIESVSMGHLDKSFLEELTKKDPQVVRKIFHYAHGTQDSDAWPRSMLDKAVLKKQFELRYQQLGSRLSDFRKYVTELVVDWGRASPYTVVFEDGKVSEINWMTVGPRKPRPHQVITKQFEPQNWFSDAGASLTLDGTTYQMRNFFDAGQKDGPWRFALGKKSEELAALEPTAATQAIVFPDGQFDPDFGAAAQKEIKQNQLNKARESVKRRKMERKAITLEDLTNQALPPAAS